MPSARAYWQPTFSALSIPDEWATTKQACRDEPVVLLVVFFFNIYFALLLCIEHCFAKIKFHTLYVCMKKAGNPTM